MDGDRNPEIRIKRVQLAQIVHGNNKIGHGRELAINFCLALGNGVQQIRITNGSPPKKDRVEVVPSSFILSRFLKNTSRDHCTVLRLFLITQYEHPRLQKDVIWHIQTRVGAFFSRLPLRIIFKAFIESSIRAFSV